MCMTLTRKKAEDFRPKRLAKFFDKRFVFNVFTGQSHSHILDYIMSIPDCNFSIFHLS